MAEAQKIRDRTMREIRSNEGKIRRIKCAREIIRDLECHGPAGLIHIIVLSDIIKRPIMIWNADGTLNRIVGDRKECSHPIHIEYHPNSESIGHWTLRHAKDPDNTDIDLNSCLFSVIASQTGQTPSQLRRWTVLRLKSDLRRLADRVNEIFQSKRNDGDATLIGGARYCGTSPRDAQAVLDASQNAWCHGCPVVGHPRGHASHPSATGDLDSVEKYSSGSVVKSAFLSRADQDLVTHWALSTALARNIMQRLNDGSVSEVCEVSAVELRKSIRPLPQGIQYSNGQPIIAPRDINSVLLLLRHHADQYRNPYANVFVHTCYPKL